MFERFTDRARKVLQHAQAEANRLNHMYVGTQHVLLGLIKEGAGIAGTVLLRLGLDLAKARETVQQLTPGDDDCVTIGRLPHSANTNRLTEYATQIAAERGDNSVGTEHLLLGLLRLPNSAAMLALLELGVQAEVVQAEVCQFVPHLDAEADAQPLVDVLQAVELAAATESDPATRRALQAAADMVRVRIGQQAEELVVPLLHGCVRVGCVDLDDPDAMPGDYLAIDLLDGESLTVEAADLVVMSPQAVTARFAAVVQMLHRASGLVCPSPPKQPAPPVHLSRWSLYHLVRWLAVVTATRGIPCTSSNWNHSTENGPTSSLPTES